MKKNVVNKNKNGGLLVTRYSLPHLSSLLSSSATVLLVVRGAVPGLTLEQGEVSSGFCNFIASKFL